MKQTLLVAALLISSISFGQVQNYNVGDVVNNFIVTDVYGVEHNLYEYTAQGKHVYLDFFFDTCVPCQTTTPIFNEFYDKYGCNQGDLIAISMNNGTDNDAAVIAFEEQYGGPFNHAPAVSADGGAGAVDADFNIAAYPTYCLIGPDNTLLENDIWPLTGVETFEATFPADFDPPVMACSLGITEQELVQVAVFPTISNGQNINIMASLPLDGPVAVYDVNGRLVHTSNGTVLNVAAGSGIYFVQLSVGGQSVTKRIVIR